MTTFRVTHLQGEQLSLVIDLAAAEGWDPGLHDASCLAAADPTVFFA